MSSHRPVMLAESVAGLAVRSGGIYLDGTFGRGGHSAAILDALNGSGELHGLDRDPDAGAHAWREFAKTANFHFHSANFGDLEAVAQTAGLLGRVDGILLDLGVSSPQLDTAARGFSFSHDGPLDMRMDPRSGASAAEWLRSADERDIANVLWRFGDERNSRRIARRIVETRDTAPLQTTAQLAALIAAVPGPRPKDIHPATRSFQAIRIHINGELDALERALASASAVLAPGGRLAIISFHSLEDRIVKRFMRDAANPPRPAFDPMPFADPRLGGVVPVMKTVGRYFPTDEEASSNPRSRSAVLRVAEKLPAPVAGDAA